MNERRWARAAVPWRASLGAVVVATDAGERVLEGPGAAVWDALDRPSTDDELFARAAARFGIDRDQSAAGLAALVEARLCMPA